MNVTEMIAEGKRMIAEELRKRDEIEAAEMAAIEAEQEKVYQRVKDILPNNLGDFLSRDEKYLPQVSKGLDNIYKADNYQTLVLSVPGCAPVRFSTYLDSGNIRNIKPASPELDSNGDLYFTFLYQTECDNFCYALALAEDSYEKYGRMQAQVTARKLIGEQDQSKKTDWLQAASGNYRSVCSDDPVSLSLTSIAAALIGILEHMKERKD